MGLLQRIIRFYVYTRLGLSNYIAFFIALFNTASLVWYFTGLKRFIPYKYFLIVVFALLLPLAALLGYYDLKKLVSKVTVEVSPYWKRAKFIDSKIFTGAMMWPPLASIFRITIKDEKINECLAKASEEMIKWIKSEGEYVPRNPCFCEVAKEIGLLDEEGYKMCLVGAVEAE